ncbi:MAG TPA: FAD-dependent oxidoreductase [Terriglobia bacterium]|nr:FAD-dependent oxidoreductase [Terriglobia bacterium]
MGKKQNGKATLNRRSFLKKGTTAGVGAAGAAALAGLGLPEAAAQGNTRRNWNLTADFVTIGAGVSGLAAAVSALDHGASVIMVEENFDIGGHGMVSGGNVHLGGGTSRQQKHGVQDSADQVFLDWVRHDHRESRYSDRDLVRAFADENAATFEFLVANGVQFHDESTGPGAASTVPRQGTVVQWPIRSERMSSEPSRRGSGLVRALEKSARAKGAKILLRHKMTGIVRENPTSGRVLGITATTEGRTVRIEAKKGVVIASGGHTSNVNFRRMFDPRRTEEYQVAGEPYSRQTGDGEIAAIAIGAALWGTANQTVEAGNYMSKTAHIGCRWGYTSLHWQPDSPIFDRVHGSGLTGVDWQNVILVNQAGRRFWNEVAGDHNFFAAAMAYSGNSSKLNGGGPIWAIFDSDAVARQKWDPRPPNVDPEYFFSGDTIAELARRISNPYQTRPIPVDVLQETVTRYNSFVDSGIDADFKKPKPRYKIQTPPFYAAWSTPILHDTLTGIRTNAKAQVMDIHGQVIPGLYCAGESQGGFAQHGLGRALVFGRIAGRDAALNGGKT